MYLPASVSGTRGIAGNSVIRSWRLVISLEILRVRARLRIIIVLKFLEPGAARPSAKTGSCSRVFYEWLSGEGAALGAARALLSPPQRDARGVELLAAPPSVRRT